MNIITDNYDDLVEVEYIEPFKIKCSFKDGESGIIEMSQYYKKGGVFSRPIVLT